MTSDRVIPKPFFIGISGGTASGKSTLSKKIFDTLTSVEERKIVIISLDSFYKTLNEEEIMLAQEGKYNFDHPDAFDFSEMHRVLTNIKEKRGAAIPDYDHQTFTKSSTQITEVPGDISVIIIEGILAFYHQDTRNMLHMKVFVDCDADTRLSRRVMRDTSEKKREVKQILINYFDFVKPAFEEFCLPTKKYADIILPRGADNIVGIDLIIQHIEDVLHHGEQSTSPGKSAGSSSSPKCRVTKTGPISVDILGDTSGGGGPSSATAGTSPSSHVWRTRQISESSAALLTRPH